MVTELAFLVATVVTTKFVELAPAGTSTLAGTFANAFDESSDTVAPPAGAALVSVTVPVEDTPPTTLVGLSDRNDSAAGVGGLTVSVVVLITPP